MLEEPLALPSLQLGAPEIRPAPTAEVRNVSPSISVPARGEFAAVAPAVSTEGVAQSWPVTKAARSPPRSPKLEFRCVVAAHQCVLGKSPDEESEEFSSACSPLRSPPRSPPRSPSDETTSCFFGESLDEGKITSLTKRGVQAHKELGAVNEDLVRLHKEYWSTPCITQHLVKAQHKGPTGSITRGILAAQSIETARSVTACVQDVLQTLADVRQGELDALEVIDSMRDLRDQHTGRERSQSEPLTQFSSVSSSITPTSDELRLQRKEIDFWLLQRFLRSGQAKTKVLEAQIQALECKNNSSIKHGDDTAASSGLSHTAAPALIALKSELSGVQRKQLWFVELRKYHKQVKPALGTLLDKILNTLHRLCILDVNAGEVGRTHQITLARLVMWDRKWEPEESETSGTESAYDDYSSPGFAWEEDDASSAEDPADDDACAPTETVPCLNLPFSFFPVIDRLVQLRNAWVKDEKLQRYSYELMGDTSSSAVLNCMQETEWTSARSARC